MWHDDVAKKRRSRTNPDCLSYVWVEQWNTGPGKLQSELVLVGPCGLNRLVPPADPPVLKLDVPTTSDTSCGPQWVFLVVNLVGPVFAF